VTKAQRVRFKNRQMEYEAWGEMYAIVQYAENFGFGPGPERQYSGLCKLAHTLHYGPYDLENFTGIPRHIYDMMLDRIKNSLGRKDWLAAPGARRPRLKWIEGIMVQVEAEATAE
jgi:hypothetical protein